MTSSGKSIGQRIRSLAHDVGMYGSSTVAGQLIAIFLLPIFTRVFSTEEYGVVALLALISLTLPPVGSLGMPSVVMRFLPHRKTPEEKGRLIGMTLVVAALASATLAAIGFALLKPLTIMLIDNPEQSRLVAIVLTTSSLTAVADVPYAVLRSMRRTRLVAALQIAATLGGALTAIYLVVYLRLGLWGYFIGGLFVQVTVAAVKLAVVWRMIRFRYDADVMDKVVKYGLPVVPHRILGLVMVVWARYAVKNYLSLAEAGLYAVAAKVAKPLERLVGMFQKAWTPFKMEESANNDDAKRVFRTVFFGYATLLGFLWLGASLFGGPALKLLTPEPYWSATKLIPALALVPICLAACWMLGTGLELGFNLARLPFVTLTAAIVAVGSSLYLVPTLGAVGAPLSVAAGHTTYASIIFVLSQRVYPIRYDWGKIVILACTAGGIVWLTHASGVESLSVTGLALRAAGLLAYAFVAFLMVRRTSAGEVLIRGVRRRLGFSEP